MLCRFNRLFRNPYLLANKNYIEMDSRIFEDNQPNIVIIGAGAAGIAAGSKLTKSGFKNITILEAESRIGGRIHSVAIDDTFVDIGAQWVHGEKGNTAYEIVKDLNILGDFSRSDYDKLRFFSSNRSKLSKNLLNKLYEISLEVLEDKCSIAESHNGIEQYFLKAYYDRIHAEFGEDNKAVMDIARMLLEWISKFILCYDPATSWNQISTEGFLIYEKCEGNLLLHWKNKGYRTIFDNLMEKIPESNTPFPLENKIFLNKEVIKVIWNNNGGGQNKVSVNCSDGSKYEADHVVVTVSIAVLRDFLEYVFDPKPPQEKLEAAKKLPLGNVMKILLRFPEKWWTDTECDFSLLWTPEDKRELLECFPNGPIHNGRSWLEDIFGFYSIESHDNILLGWLIGPMVKDVELLSDDEVQEGCMFLLNKFLGNQYKISKPDYILRSAWGTNPHFKGTYSYVGTETIDATTIRQTLIEPLRINEKDVVLFAGEATHTKYFSTVHGAIDTGYREADRLIKLYRRPQRHKIAIVGAGMAGLGAATELMKENIEDFVILEAQDRPGGRIQTILVDNKSLDLGAQWLHGKDNPLYQLAVKHKLLADEMSEEGLGLYVRSNGDIVDSFTVERTSFEVGTFFEECEKFVNQADYPSSVGAYIQERFKNYIAGQPSELQEVLQELYDWHDRFQVIDNSCTSLTKLSAKSWGEYVCLDDVAHYNLKYGYQSLIDVILDNLPKSCVKYNSEVKRINLDEDKRVVLYLSNNQIVICDHLILTPSLGVLKSIKELTRILPDHQTGSIKRMGFAGICKIYLFYDDLWWGDSRGFQLLWTKDCDFPERQTWLRYVTGFDEVFNHPNALMTWVGGDAVEEAENLSTEDIGQQCTELLRKFLPNYKVPSPTRVIRTRWLNNRFVRGSYCHTTPECDGTNYGIRSLGAPLFVDGVPRIVLAGEAVHPAHFSTAHGAFESGQEQAHVLAQFIASSANK
ncbi:hypothetical protein GWI33_004312 [Rhynchophorus ferrugineus]|uniref:Amine oxidase domain-containing protein n=1 Tax=Rhynchophorus ferrugineus TaxID=354439 RepID=A0A834IIZ7_RHYFE|nr:hypothetical protein GWI33_004312 [Rhynchophorus ferrugineus]